MKKVLFLFVLAIGILTLSSCDLINENSGLIDELPDDIKEELPDELKKRESIKIIIDYQMDDLQNKELEIDLSNPVFDEVDPTTVGYLFDGWYTDLEFTTPFNLLHELEKDEITIYAKWITETVLIQYYIDGVFFDEIEIPKGDDYIFEMPEVGFEKSFDGWYSDPEMTQPIIDVTGLETDLTLYGSTFNEDILDLLPSEQIDISFWYIYLRAGDEIDEVIADFETLYPNINVTAEYIPYQDIYEETITALNQNQQPNIVETYQDELNVYLGLDAVEHLDKFFDHPEYGDDWDSYVETLVNENHYSVPFRKYTDLLYYNKTLIDNVNFPVPNDRPLTFYDLEALSNALMGNADNRCDYFANYDNENNLLGSLLWMNGMDPSLGLTNIIDNMDIPISSVSTYFDNNVFTFPSTYDQVYGSNMFKAGDTCMLVSVSQALIYNVPSDNSFELGITFPPQLNSETVSYSEYGSDLVIMDTTLEEELASWLFVQFLTNAENTMRFKKYTNLPVRDASYDSAEFIDFIQNDDPSSQYYYQGKALSVSMEMLPDLKEIILPFRLGQSREMIYDAFYGSSTIDDFKAELEEFFVLELSTADLLDEFDVGLPYDLYEIDTDISLPSHYRGYEITWSSNDDNIDIIDGVLTRSEGIDPFTVILEASMVFNDITYRKEFLVRIIPKPFEDEYFGATTLYQHGVLEEVVDVTGVITFVYGSGYYVSDGVNAVFVYDSTYGLNGANPVQVGDEVNVRGLYTKYYDMHELKNVESLEVISSGNEITQPVIELTLAEIAALDYTDPTTYGKIIKVSGIVVQQGEYNNLYLIDSVNEVGIYYNSPELSILALEEHINDIVTIEVIYYRYYGVNQIVEVFFYGDSDDIVVVE